MVPYSRNSKYQNRKWVRIYGSKTDELCSMVFECINIPRFYGLFCHNSACHYIRQFGL